MYIKLDREYEIKSTLGTIREIERMFNKAFFDVINGITSMKVEEQIKLLFAGVKKANPDIKENDFISLCEDHLGMGELMDYIEQYIFALQYPGLTEEEVQNKLEKKLARSKALAKDKGK